jgi:hypothetical protein
VYKQNNLRMLPQIILKRRLTVRFRRMNSSGIRRKQKSQMSEKICGDISAGTVAGDIDTSRNVREVYRRDSCARTLAPFALRKLLALLVGQPDGFAAGELTRGRESCGATRDHENCRK